jgi:hypothetical protein
MDQNAGGTATAMNESKEKTVTLTEAQAKNAMQLLDLAVKAGGLNASVLALPIAQAIEEQLTAKEKTE